MPRPICRHAIVASLILCATRLSFADEYLTIHGRIIASRHIKALPEIEIVNREAIAQWGRRLPNDDLILDDQSSAIANVLVWAQTNCVNANKPKTHRVFLVDGKYVPKSLIAIKGDILEFHMCDSVGDAPCLSELRVKPLFPDNTGRAVIELNAASDKPIAIESSIHPWLKSQLFIQESTVAAKTNRLGEFSLQVPSAPKVRLKIWHGHLGPPILVGRTQAVEVQGPGECEINTNGNSMVEVEILVAPAQDGKRISSGKDSGNSQTRDGKNWGRKRGRSQ